MTRQIVSATAIVGLVAWAGCSWAQTAIKDSEASRVPPIVIAGPRPLADVSLTPAFRTALAGFDGCLSKADPEDLEGPKSILRFLIARACDAPLKAVIATYMDSANYGPVTDIDECHSDGVCRATYQNIYDLILGRGVQITVGESPRWPAAD